MSELRDKVAEGLCTLQLANLSTITEDGKPWTRYVMISGDEEFTLRCATFLQARKVAQIEKNPEVHLSCGVTDPMQMGAYYQVQAKAEVVTDAAEKEAFWNFTLKEIFSGPDDPNYAVVIMKPYRIERWSPGVMEPEVLLVDE